MKYFWLTIFIIGTLTFWGLSLVPGEESAKMSDNISKPIIDVITKPDNPLTGEELDKVHFLTRKIIGHFLMNAGISFSGFLSLYLIIKHRHLTFIMMILVGLLIACIAEGLQFIPNNRYPSWNDVLINSIGSAASILFLYIMTWKFPIKKVCHE